MKLLLIVAHGSRLKSSNEEIIELVKKVQYNSSKNLLVKYAFLELESPNITQCIESTLKETSIKEIDIFPYFLAAGKHVKFDIPNEIDEIKNKHSEIKINLLPHLGKNEALINLILNA